MLAAEIGSSELVMLLLMHGAKPGVADSQGRTALYCGVSAVFRGRVLVFTWLMVISRLSLPRSGKGEKCLASVQIGLCQPAPIPCNLAHCCLARTVSADTYPQADPIYVKLC